MVLACFAHVLRVLCMFCVFCACFVHVLRMFSMVLTMVLFEFIYNGFKFFIFCYFFAIFGVAVIQSAASAASPEKVFKP